jgi:phosphohistidine swiveling domain-containing protein
MSWSKIASGLFASKPSNVEGTVRVVVGLQAIVDLMRDADPEPRIIVTNVAGGSAISTIIQRAQAIVSTIGGPNSHVVVVARDYQTPCIVGASQLDLSVLTTGVKMRLRSNGDIEIRKDDLAHPTERQLTLLRKIAFAGAIRSPDDVIGYESTNLTADIDELAALGMVSNDGLIALTTEGTSLFESAYVKDRKGLSDKDHVGLHTDFRPLDRELKRIAREWQDAERRNDWDDRLKTIEALTGLHARTKAFFDKYHRSVPRLDEYLQRLTRAHNLVVDGSTEYVVSVRVDSYHTIWFQLHEDLLRILQRERDPE